MNKILVTGGAGFIGERLASALADNGHEVHLVDNFFRGHHDEALDGLIRRDNVRFFEIDLTAPGALDSLSIDYNVVVHLAAIVGVQNVVGRPYHTLRDNILMHDAAIRFGKRQKSLQRFLFASTSEVYAATLLHLDIPIPTPEESPIVLPALHEPRSAYMLSKVYGEAMIQQSGLPFTIVRPHNVYGPRMGMSHVVPQLLEKAHRAHPNSTLEVFSVEHTRSFCYIDDAIKMLKNVLFCETTLNQVLNLGAEGPEVTIRHIAEIVIATVGKPLRVDAQPPTPGSPSRRAPKMQRMAETTGCRAQVQLEQGIRQTYDWYRVNIFDKRNDRDRSTQVLNPDIGWKTCR